MSTEVVVTVIGSAGRGDVCLDGSVPISTLLADLTRHYCAPDHVDEVVLADDSGVLLDPAISLHQAGVTHGTRLRLRGRLTESLTASLTASPPVVLPQRDKLARRLRHSWSAAARSGRATRPSEPAFGATPSPAELTLPDAPGVVARWRRAWEDTDYLHRLDRAIIRPQLTRCATIAVVSPKGGVGKTTTTALLGTLVAHLRRDLVVAVDANPDYGSLGRVLCPTHQFFVDDLATYFAGNASAVPSMADLNARLGAGPHGLRVLPAPTDPDRMRGIGFDTYRDVIARLKDYAGLLLLDCGTGLHEPAAQASLQAADMVVVVSDADPATASLVAEAISGIPLTAPLVLVVNKMPSRGGRLDLNRLAETLPGVDQVVVIPSDPRAASALGIGAFCWDGVPEGWQRSVRELAAGLIAGWGKLGLERQSV
jgi:MinD-like ATPase involved in chromosome partitioning or flagellar assembly